MGHPAAHILTRRSQTHPKAKPRAVEVAPNVTLQLGRVHECCGANRRTMAMMVAAKMDGPVFWIVPDWVPDRPHSDGMQSFVNPGRLTFITPHRAEDLLWSVEESLRSGTVPLVVADLPGLPALTPVRRLHLAAETGSLEGSHTPLGLILTPGDGGAPGVESRWHMAACHDGIQDGGPHESWKLSRRKARTLPPQSWQLFKRHGQLTTDRLPG